MCPRWTAENLDRLARVLSELGAELAIGPGETVPVPVIDGVLLSRMEIGTWQTRVGRFDILRSIPKSATARADYEELSAHATAGEISGRAICVADVQDVIRSKQIADRPKDREALRELQELRHATGTRPQDAHRPSPSRPPEPQQPSPSSQRAYQPPSARVRRPAYDAGALVFGGQAPGGPSHGRICSIHGYSPSGRAGIQGVAS